MSDKAYNIVNTRSLKGLRTAEPEEQVIYFWKGSNVILVDATLSAKKTN